MFLEKLAKLKSFNGTPFMVFCLGPPIVLFKYNHFKFLEVNLRQCTISMKNIASKITIFSCRMNVSTVLEEKQNNFRLV